MEKIEKIPYMFDIIKDEFKLCIDFQSNYTLFDEFKGHEALLDLN